MSLEKAAERGVPSLVWRAGQARRLAIVVEAAGLRLANGVVLDACCGVGMYLRAFRDFTPHVFGVDIEPDHVRNASEHGSVALARGEELPFADGCFDLILSHEVIEHVEDDRACVAAMVRLLKPGGRLVLFCPNRLYPFETHGHYWRGRYHFGNVPLVNYLPDRWRNRLVPHVRAYTTASARRLFAGLPVRLIRHTQIFPGFDNLVARRPALGRLARRVLYRLERSPLRAMGLSHLVVIEKT